MLYKQCQIKLSRVTVEHLFLAFFLVKYAKRLLQRLFQRDDEHMSDILYAKQANKQRKKTTMPHFLKMV